MSSIEERLAEIKESSARIGRPVDWFIITAPYQTLCEELDRKYSAKFLEGEVRDGVLHAMMAPIKKADDIVLFVNVWNCQASLAVDEGHTTRNIEVPTKLQAKFDKAAEKIIYDENHGMINMSGLYYPKTERSARTLRSIYLAATKKGKK